MSAEAPKGTTAMIACPACGGREFDLRSFDSMMVLAPGLALFGLTCPGCGAKVSAMQPIPPELREEVEFAAIRVGAGMGQAS